jgi:sugar phosphate isomerase/epimerase
MAYIPTALQLYSVREDCAKDLPFVLDKVAKMGYDGVEFAGYYGNEAAPLRKLLDDNGLKVAGTHTGIDTILGDELKRTVEFNQIIGNKFLIVPWLPPKYTSTKAGWLDAAATFNAVDQQLRPLGMYTGYHNHHTEFTPLDGELPWDLFFGNTDHRVVMQFDTGNALLGGGEALQFLNRYPGRALTIHLKEYSKTNSSALVGEGDVPWTELIRTLNAQGATQWYIIEQESYAHPPLECVEKCIINFKACLQEL